MKHENLNGRVAVVTGGGGVLCGDFSKVLAKQGVKVAVLDLNEAAAQKVVDEITADGGTAIAVGCNVLDPESMQKAREVVNEKLGTCDILLNGAGGSPLPSFNLSSKARPYQWLSPRFAVFCTQSSQNSAASFRACGMPLPFISSPHRAETNTSPVPCSVCGRQGLKISIYCPFSRAQ